MTLEEAKALVLREGLAGDDAPEDAAFILLHFGDEPSHERMKALLKAINVVCDDLRGETVMDRSLAAALWTLGNSSNDCLFAHEQYGRPWGDGVMDEVIALIMTVEGVFYDVPFGGMRMTAKD